MYKKIGLASLIIVCAMGFLYPEKPLKHFLADYLSNDIAGHQMGALLVRALLLIPALWILKRFEFMKFSGLKPWVSPKNAYAMAIPLTIILLGVFINWANYFEVSVWLVMVFFLKTLSVGFYEEFIFRGIAFPLLIKAFKENKNAILIAALLSSFIFGLLHYVNLIGDPDNFAGITNQVFFATAIGVFFCGIMIRTENILVPVVLHTLVNFGFGSADLIEVVEETTQIAEDTGVNWSSVIPTTIFFMFILCSGVYMILKSETEAILQKLESDCLPNADPENIMS